MEIEARIDADKLLTPAQKDELRKQARDHVRDKIVKKAMEEFKAAAIAEEERALVPDEKTEYVSIDLPDHAAFIRLDNVVFFHGLTYEVSYLVARTMADVMARAWEHQHEIDGHRRRGDITRRPHNTMMRPGMENLSIGVINSRQTLNNI
jgi:hypothetical protein